MISTIQELRDKMHEMWNLAKKYDIRVQSGKKRLKSFSLWKRLIFVFEFDKIRNIIKQREAQRFMVVAMALGASKRIRQLEKRQREQERKNSNKV